MRRRIRRSRSGKPSLVRIFPRPGRPSQGILNVGDRAVPCALGRSGVTHLKREGDGATPAGRHRLLAVMVRSDRIAGPATRVPLGRIRRDGGWCDEPRSGRYNCPVHRPYPASHEALWRDDHLYDLVGVLDWNIRPRASRAGSAIFVHLCRAGFAPTEGCVALRRGDLLRLLSAIGRNPEFAIAASPRRIRR
ncbi:L,D-transpeptidase family protein [Faunimonas sp. B44]|uniref:L,D-transpeptidase family protein n=1 Tax=Faunimonas sp. B44 TaxID=3461493 RepID=UPI00404484E8